MTIPAVLEQLQQIRERAGLPPLRIEPMLAYHANLDALLVEHMATQRILATHVTDASQAARGNTARLNDPAATQVGVGISHTERGDAVVVILLGRQVTEARALPRGNIGTAAATAPPTPREEIPQTDLQPHETSAAPGTGFRLLTRLTKIKR